MLYAKVVVEQVGRVWRWKLHIEMSYGADETLILASERIFRSEFTARRNAAKWAARLKLSLGPKGEKKVAIGTLEALWSKIQPTNGKR